MGTEFDISTGPKTLICVPVMVHSVEHALAQALAAAEAGADIVEFRIDEFFAGDLEAPAGGPHRSVLEVEQLIQRSPLPVIVTCRSSDESGGFGGYDGDEDARVSLYERLGVGSSAGHSPARPPAFLDFEWSSLARSANIRQKIRLAVRHDDQLRAVTPRLILSTHDFTGRPADLSRRLLAMQDQDAASVVKVAFHARSLRDNLEVFDLLRERQRPMIALAMGEFGLLSRVLAPKFGAFLTFAALRPAATTAPGQPTVSDLINLYRFRSIRRSTRVYGVVGWPVGHSLSPLVHNAAFERTGHDGVYVPLPIPTSSASDQSPLARSDDDLIFKSTLLSLLEHEPLQLSGLSVTLPHKERLVRLAREQGWHLDDASRATGAANTLMIDRQATTPHVRVLNTDIAAAVELLHDALGALGGKSVAVVGAGGVGRTIAWGLAAAGAHVHLLARDARKSQAAADALNDSLPRGAGKIHAAAIPADACLDGHDAYVNATPVGMAGGPDPHGVPFIVCGATPAHAPVVFDTVYNPINTPLLTRAARPIEVPASEGGTSESGWGCRTIDGVAMFVRQALAQSRLFTGSNLDHASMFDQLVRDRLKPGPEGIP